jgi:hypothetical protein
VLAAARARLTTLVWPDNDRKSAKYTNAMQWLACKGVDETDTVATLDLKRPGNVYIWQALYGKPMRLVCMLAPPENKHHAFWP